VKTSLTYRSLPGFFGKAVLHFWAVKNFQLAKAAAYLLHRARKLLLFSSPALSALPKRQFSSRKKSENQQCSPASFIELACTNHHLHHSTFLRFCQLLYSTLD